MRHSDAEIVREYGPFADADNVGGVTYDGTTCGSPPAAS